MSGSGTGTRATRPTTAVTTTTVATLLAQIAAMVQEDTSFSSGLWSITTELIPWINYVQRDFVRKTGVLMDVTNVSASSGVRLYSDPTASMDIDRIAFDDVALYRATVHTLDREDENWRTKSGRPRKYHQDQLATKKFEVDRAPTAALAAAAHFEVVHIRLITDVTATTSTLQVPDFAIMYLKYGVLERMLSKEGEGQDLLRAQYCHRRYNQGINLTRRLMGLPPIEEDGRQNAL